MLKKLVLVAGISAIAMAPVSAAEDFYDLGDFGSRSVAAQLQPLDVVEQEIVRPSAGQMAYQAYDGGKDLAFGAYSIAKAGGRLIKNVVQAGTAVAEAFAAAGQAATGIVKLPAGGFEEANPNFAKAKVHGAEVVTKLKAVVADAPQNFADLKDGLVQGYEGVKKFGTSIYEAGRAVAESKHAQTAFGAVKAAATKVGSFFGDVYSFVRYGFGPTFDNVKF